MSNKSNSNPFLNPELINPKLTADLADAFEKNKAKALANNSLGSVAVASLADIVKDDTKTTEEELSNHSRLDLVFTNMDNFLDNPEKLQRTFETAFANAEKLFGRIDIVPPTPEQFTKAGVDFLNLAIKYERMEKEGLKPSLIINPILQLENSQDNTNIPLRQSWRNLYNQLTSDRTIPNNPLIENNSGNGIWISDEMQTNTEYFFQQEIDLVTKYNNIHHITESDNNLIWTIALVPTTNKPQKLDTTHKKHERKDTYSQHITISQYLTIQTNRIQSGLKPLDDEYYTWLQGTINDDLKAPYGYWDSGCGQIYIHWLDTIGHYDSLGVRLPVWG